MQSSVACFVHEKQFDKGMEIWKKGIEHKHKVFLDQLLPSARVQKVEFSIPLVESATRMALEYYSSRNDIPREYLAILHNATHMYDQAIDNLYGQNSYMLANLFVLQEKFADSMMICKKILTLKDYDLAIIIGILLKTLTTKKVTSKKEPIVELTRIEKLLVDKIGGHEAIRLRMIINDHLAETFLSMKQYADAVRCSRISLDLKQRHYFFDHPSLVRNYQLVASCSVEQEDYKNAVGYYEKAIEIQLKNMPSEHRDIRSNYFLLGDCYCQMGKIELACEYYDRAQASNDIDANDDREVERDVKSLIRMHSNLAKGYAKQKDFTSANTHQQSKIDSLKEVCPSFIIEVIENEDALSIPLVSLQTTLVNRLGLKNGKAFGEVLGNFVFLSLSLARALLHTDKRTENDEDEADLYEQAIELESKLIMFKLAGQKRLGTLHEELSNAYAKLYYSMEKSIENNLVQALDETTDASHQRSLEFRLGNLCFGEKAFSEADRYWKRALEKVHDSQTIV